MYILWKVNVLIRIMEVNTLFHDILGLGQWINISSAYMEIFNLTYRNTPIFVNGTFDPYLFVWYLLYAFRVEDASHSICTILHYMLSDNQLGNGVKTVRRHLWSCPWLWQWSYKLFVVLAPVVSIDGTVYLSGTELRGESLHPDNLSFSVNNLPCHVGSFTAFIPCVCGGSLHLTRCSCESIKMLQSHLH